MYILGVVGLLGAVSAFSGPAIQHRILHFICHISVAALTHTALLWPYLRDTQNFNVGIHRAQWTSPLDDFLSHWGVFLGIAFIFFGISSTKQRREHRKHNITVHILPEIFRRNKLVKSSIPIISIGLLGLCILEVSAAFAITIFGVFYSLILAEYECRRSEPDVGKLFAIVMFLFGFAVIGGPEVITINNDVARMNTVFKFWLQGWLFFAIGSAFAIHHIWSFIKEAQNSKKEKPSIFRATPQMVWRLFVL